MSWFSDATGIDINLTGHKASGGGNNTQVNEMAQPQGIMTQENLDTITGNQGTMAGNQTTMLGNQGTMANAQNTMLGNQNVMSDAIGSKGQTFDFSGFADGVTLNDSLSALKQSVGLQEQDLKYDVNGDGVVDRRDGEGMMSNLVGLNPDTQNTGLYKEFSDQNRVLTDNFGNIVTDLGTLKTGQTNMGTRFDTVDTNLGALQGDVTTGFGNMDTRFNTVDQNVQSANDALGNQLTTNDLSGLAKATDLSGLAQADQFGDMATSDQFDGLAQANQFDDVATAQSLTDAQAGIDKINTDFGSISGTMLENQGTMAGNQAEIKNSFDAYVDRYGEDEALAVQARTDLDTGLSNLATGQQGLGTAVANAQTGIDNNQTAISSAETDLAADIEGGFVDQNSATNALAQGQTNLAADIEGGFSTQEMANQDRAIEQAGLMATNQDSLSNTMVGMRDNLVNLSGRIPRQQATLANQFRGLARSFDAQGQLIQNEILANGNAVGRTMMPSGILQETTYSPRGEVLGQQQYDVNGLLGQANGMMQPAA